ncbi:DNA phosphorothioation-dependent restriction protein DptG [Psychromonas sp. psych-6C06]|uniref:DNA phosphorothioation-dependent restriction protein DptG n=1 Tax=Psychromonas sp. psych-6C06 TaxID=2058089 RepID=UPI000C336A9A|nr:DNA phosphorothioation-dependent restriction protein DptG [Psychromonas sp. psych-6C06]PKF63761.1 DNA phosphorothioation-dependent restriction protein DptG [Psychromonas sp. psych-6C06]
MIKEQLDIPANNKLSTYLPLRTKSLHYKFCWDTVLGYFVRVFYGKEVKKITVDDFKELCKKRLSPKIEEEPDFWLVLEKMYFEHEQIFKISPELLIFKAVKGEIDTNSKKLGDMYLGLLNGFNVPSSAENNLNFLEKEIKSEFDNFYETGKGKARENEETPYLPFLTELFQQDLLFLSKRPQYLLNNFNAFIRLYGFLYVSQMALNIKNWSNGAPTSKPCYFIIDNEKASDERSQVKNYGYGQLNEYLEYLFPYLVMNETLQEKGDIKPIWQLFEGLTDDHISKLNDFGKDFVEDRHQRKWYKKPLNWTNTNDNNELLAQLLDIAHAQFEKGKGGLTTFNDTVRKGLLGNICDPFIQRRGRAGQVLTFNQDYIVLLTNLAIGEKEKLRLHELLDEFEARGIFFDKQSQQCLIDFYERMGNVERMSDSGDAVYVRKTV